MTENNGNGWREYQKLVLTKLDDHDSWLASLDKRMGEIRLELAKLGVRLSLWSSIAGGLAGLLAVLTAMLLRKL